MTRHNHIARCPRRFPQILSAETRAIRAIRGDVSRP